MNKRRDPIRARSHKYGRSLVGEQLEQGGKLPAKGNEWDGQKLVCYLSIHQASRGRRCPWLMDREIM